MANARTGPVGVLWGDDFGVVDLTARTLVVTSYGHRNVNFHVPYCEITDDDFAVLLPARGADGADDRKRSADLFDVATWGNVCALLAHAQFAFESRVVPPGTDRRGHGRDDQDR